MGEHGAPLCPALPEALLGARSVGTQDGAVRGAGSCLAANLFPLYPHPSIHVTGGQATVYLYPLCVGLVL